MASAASAVSAQVGRDLDSFLGGSEFLLFFRNKSSEGGGIGFQ